MNKELRILVLEDVPADVTLISHELRTGGLPFSTKRVETRDEFIRELEQNPPDLILSDHGLPAFDGFSALEIARDRCPDTPFIFVTGTMGEELAIDSLRSGATDYVLKTRMANLVPAVQRALHLAEERTKRKLAEKDLRDSEERFRLLVSGVKDYAIFMLDPEGRISSWNAGAELVLGHRAHEVMGEPFRCFYRVQEREQGKPQKDLKIAEEKGRFEDEGWRLRKGNDPFWAHVDIRALRDDDGRLRGFTQVTRDVTERRRHQEALRKSEARKAAVLETALDAIVSIDQNGKIIEWNPAAERIFGYSRELALGRDMAELLIPKSSEEMHRKGMARYLQTGRGRVLGHRTEMMALRANGAEFPVEISITKIPGDGPTIFTCFIRDITDRRRTEEALRKSEERFRLLVEGVEDYAIFMLDTHGRITTWNVGAERIEGYRTQEIIGRRFHRFYSQEDVERKKPDQALAVATAEGRYHDERRLVRKDGSQFWASFVITALRDENGKLTGFSTIARDITQRKHAEDEIRRLNSELEKQVQERTAELQAAYQEMEAFSYSISHDLRAPLIHIAGFVEMLRAELEPKLDEKSRRHLQTICDSSEQMGRMIADLLAFSRIGRADLHKVRVSLGDTVRDVQRELQGLIRDRKVTWAIAPLPEVFGDPFLLRQAFFNLMANAVKFTRGQAEARIEIGAEATERENILFIRDNGVGFDMKYAAKLFGVFQRLHSASEFEGTGIGLAIVRCVIQRHGGRTWAEGAAGTGATFYLSLPVFPEEKK
ncbi:MAG: PAS domain S-box protein [Opitutaceae bacterium]|nr:PAS domain S-box protein [Opitutaceae bacterium]